MVVNLAMVFLRYYHGITQTFNIILVQVLSEIYHRGWKESVRENDCIVVGDWRELNDSPHAVYTDPPAAGIFGTFAANSTISSYPHRGSPSDSIIS